MLQPTRLELRKFILDHFNRNDLEILCSDYFPDFYRDYEGSEIVLTKIVHKLIEYCDQHGFFENLNIALHKHRPNVYEPLYGRPNIVEIPIKPRNPNQVFLCYAYEDILFTQKLTSDLRKFGIQVWIAPESIQPGEKWAKSIDRGLRESGIFVVVISPQAAKSSWVEEEILAAIQLEHDGQIEILPLSVQPYEPSTLPIYLQSRQFIDFKSDYDDGLIQLIQKIRKQMPLNDIKHNHNPISSLTQSLLNLKLNKRRFFISSGILTMLGISSIFASKQGLMPHFFSPNTKSILPDSTPLQLPGSINKISEKLLEIVIAPNISMQFVKIQAGEFTMGSDESIFNEEKPQHIVNLPEYWIGKTEVTVAQFSVFINEKNYESPYYLDISNKSNHPVVNVTWIDCVSFCRWMSNICKQIIFRLPSEAEWEKAARGTDGRIYPWGDDKPDSTRCNFDKKEKDTKPVGSYKSLGVSPYGCDDMAGNVWEWTNSLWGVDYITPMFDYPYTQHQSEREDLQAGKDVLRILRGGSFSENSAGIRCTVRTKSAIDTCFNFYGFRVAFSPISNL